MAQNLPQSDVPDVREYLYVDTARVTSLLAQIADGLPTEIQSAEGRTRRLRLGIEAIGFSAAGEDSQTETIALADLHVSMLEQGAEALGLLADHSGNLADPRAWKQAKVRKLMTPGSLVRITAPTILVDAASLITTLDRLRVAAKDSDHDMAEFSSFLGALYGEATGVSIRPTEPTDPNCSFVGAIPHTNSFPSFDRELLASRLGTHPVELTSLVQISNTPTERDTTSGDPLVNINSAFDRLKLRTGFGDALDRGLLDDLIRTIITALGELGVMAAARWPAMSVTPLAIYRHVPMAAIQADDEVATV